MPQKIIVFQPGNISSQLKVNLDFSVWELRRILEEKWSISWDSHKLEFQGKEIVENDSKLRDLNIRKGSFIFLRSEGKKACITKVTSKIYAAFFSWSHRTAKISSISLRTELPTRIIFIGQQRISRIREQAWDLRMPKWASRETSSREDRDSHYTKASDSDLRAIDRWFPRRPAPQIISIGNRFPKPARNRQSDVESKCRNRHREQPELFRLVEVNGVASGLTRSEQQQQLRQAQADDEACSKCQEAS